MCVSPLWIMPRHSYPRECGPLMIRVSVLGTSSTNSPQFSLHILNEVVAISIFHNVKNQNSSFRIQNSTLSKVALNLYLLQVIWLSASSGCLVDTRRSISFLPFHKSSLCSCACAPNLTSFLVKFPLLECVAPFFFLKK